MNMLKGEMQKLGRHWLCCGDPSNYDDAYEALSKTYSKHYIRIMGGSLSISKLILDYRNKNYTGNGKAYPEAQELTAKWNGLSGKYMKVNEVRALAGIITEHSKDGDVIISPPEFTAETLIACEATGRIALVMSPDSEKCERIKSKWLAINKGR